MADTSSSQYTELAKGTTSLLDTIPDVFFGANGATPAPAESGLSPLQLALLSTMTSGSPPALGINQDFLLELKRFSDTGIVNANLLYPEIVNGTLLALGNEVFLLRDAQDCGPDDTNRTEQVFVGTTTELTQTISEKLSQTTSQTLFEPFTHYGNAIIGGTLSNGSSVGSGYQV